MRLWHEENTMGEIISKVRGKIKQTAGKLTGNKRLEREGKLEEVKGAVRGVVKDVKRTVKRAVKK
jgi:uncharacterized protein YjbJ (UPF0337 family)